MSQENDLCMKNEVSRISNFVIILIARPSKAKENILVR